jgi:hypothetical protein
MQLSTSFASAYGRTPCKHDVTERRLLSEMTKRYLRGGDKYFVGKHCLGQAFVVESSVVKRGIVTAVMWLSMPHYPIKTVSSTDEAIAWASRIIAAKKRP